MRTIAHSPLITNVVNEMDKIAPRFEIQENGIQVLRTPADFYKTLKTRILSAKRRIFLSTLYIGKEEHDLIDTLRQALRKNPQLQVSILVDALRGTREAPQPSCAGILVPLVEEFGDRVEVRLYHTPNFTGVKKRIVPKRLNEGWGLQHMKLYGIDDAIIMSGANLSSDYFTNRQDRYHLISSAQLTDYFARIHDAVCSISFLVHPGPASLGGFITEWPSSNLAPIPTEAPSEYKLAATKILAPLIAPPPSTLVSTAKTYIYPLAHLTPLLSPVDTSTEHPALCSVLRLLQNETAEGAQWFFTAGYFNIHPTLKSLLLQSKSVNGTVVTAAPEANGFYGSKGVSNMLPPAYALLARRFLEDVIKAGLSEQVQLREWKKGVHGKDPDAWTYHAKGVWLTLPNETEPSVTLVGSSNYTKRSYSLDLEMNAMIVTTDENLKKELKGEVDNLLVHTKAVDMDDFRKTDRRVSLKVRIALWLVGVLGGQL